MTGWTDWSDWSGDWSDWNSDWATDWASDWATDWASDWSDYALSKLSSSQALQYTPYKPPEQVYVNQAALERAYEAGITRKQLAKLGITNPQILMLFPGKTKKGKKGEAGKGRTKEETKAGSGGNGYTPQISGGMSYMQKVIHGLAPPPDQINKIIRNKLASGESPSQIAREMKQQYGVDVTFSKPSVTVNLPVPSSAGPEKAGGSGNRGGSGSGGEGEGVDISSLLSSLVTKEVPDFRSTLMDALRAGVPALNLVEMARGVQKGVEYHNLRKQYEAKARSLEEKRRRIEGLIEEGKRSGKITEEETENGKQLVVHDTELYNKLVSREEQYEKDLAEVKKLEKKLKSKEKEITPPFSAENYPVVGKGLHEFEKSTYSWLKEQEKKAPSSPLMNALRAGVPAINFVPGVGGEFATGAAMSVAALPEIPAFLMNIAAKPQAVGASLAVQAIERPAELAGMVVGGVLAGKAIGVGAEKVVAGAGRIAGMLTDQKPVKQTVIVGDRVVYEGKPLNRPLLAESTRIEDIRPVNMRVERTVAEYRDFRVEGAEVEEGAELDVKATPVRAAKVESVEPGWRITLRKPEDVTQIVEYRSIVDRLKGRKSVVVSRSRGSEISVTAYRNVRDKVGEGVASFSAENVKRITARVKEEYEMPESDTAVIRRGGRRAGSELKPKVRIDDVIRDRIERVERAEKRGVGESEGSGRMESESGSGSKQKLKPGLEQKNVRYLPRVEVEVEEPTVQAKGGFSTPIPLVPAIPVINLPGLSFHPAAGFSIATAAKSAVRPAGSEKGREVEIPVIGPVPRSVITSGLQDLLEPKSVPRLRLEHKPGLEVEPQPRIPKPQPMLTLMPLPGPTPLYRPPILLPPQAQPAGTRLTAAGPENKKDWWTGLFASFNVLSSYEMSGIRKGRKGAHLLAPSATPYWEKFLMSAGFASIPVAQQIEAQQIELRGERKGWKKKKKRGKRKKRG